MIARIPTATNPVLAPGVRALEAWLLSRDYSQYYREAIGRYVAAHGELDGAVDRHYLDREDLATATEVLIDALGVVPADSPAWSDPGVWLDVDSILEAAQLIAIEPPDGWPDAPDYHFSRTRETEEARVRQWYRDHADPLAAAGIRPISGGAPAGPIPTAADRRDFEAWLDQVDRSLPTAEQCADVAEALYGPGVNRFA